MPMWEPNDTMVGVLRDTFGADVFDEVNQRKHLSPSAFKQFSSKLKNGEHSMIDVDLADQVAEGMKNWAVARGCTHWTHWFQPLTGLCAEKHDTFIGRTGPDGHPLMDLKGSELIRMEPDASSFPSGGLRNTAEARGYTVWDPVSPSFLIHYEYGATLYIPCAFVSWSKVSLDNKTPLLKSEEALSEASVELLNTIGDVSTRVYTNLGVEQEFFIVDRKQFLKRPDLLLSGRTVQGAMAPKGQEMEDHYFGTIPRPIVACLQDMEMQLWRLGIPVTTRHNEVAPAQHEFAPLFEATSVAVDHQQLLMTVMMEKARDHGMEVLMHEKPFANVNGSGKHNNWSLATNQGVNLLNPPKDLLKNPRQALEGLENIRFVTFLTAVIKAVDDYAGALRCSIVGAGQDFRLGACEAPPAIISVYLGGALQDVVDAVMQGKTVSPGLTMAVSPEMECSSRLPHYMRDRTDRNRTSPFAFVGNKFEFRAVGSSQNVSVPVCALNCAMACATQDMCKAFNGKIKEGMSDSDALKAMLVDTLTNHFRVLFNGNGYSPEWPIEAMTRGLENYTSTPKALMGVDQAPMYTRTNVMTAEEVEARKSVAIERYINIKRIEAKCLVKMSSSNFIPSAQKALTRMRGAQKPKAAGQPQDLFDETVDHMYDLLISVMKEQKALKQHLAFVGTPEEEAVYIDDTMSVSMETLRTAADEIEDLCATEEWTLPTYTEMLFMQC